jgi:hypothetical protein
VCCLFVADFGGLGLVARFLTRWLDQDWPCTSSKSALSSIVIVADDLSTPGTGKGKARKALLLAVQRGTDKNVLEHVTAIDIFTLLPNEAWNETRYR